MAFSVPNETVLYVLEADRTMPPELQTVFYLKPRTGTAGTRIMAKYSQARVSRGGSDKIDVDRWLQAGIAEFLETVVKVENYLLDPKSDETLVRILVQDSAAEPQLSYRERNYYSITTEQRDQLTAIAKIMSPADMAEISEAATNMSQLREGEKKRSS